MKRLDRRMAKSSAPRLYLIDGSGYIFRAYHALPPLTRASDGLSVGAVAGFCNMLWKFLEEMKGAEAPTHLALIFDKSEVTFRNKLYPEYKAHRPPAPEGIRSVAPNRGNPTAPPPSRTRCGPGHTGRWRRLRCSRRH